ncbi:SAM-dependent methyltransferase, partial [Burkholderia pseudomallei]
LGPDTQRELRAACAQAAAAAGAARADARVLDDVDMHALGDMLGESGFEIPVMDHEPLTVTYKSPESRLADVRRLGASP